MKPLIANRLRLDCNHVTVFLVLCSKLFKNVRCSCFYMFHALCASHSVVLHARRSIL